MAKSSASGIRAGKAYVEVGADTSKLGRGLRAAQQRLEAYGSAVRNVGLRITTMGVGMLAPILAAAKSFADAGSELADMSARTGVAVGVLQELGFAASMTGASVEALEKGLAGMARMIYDAQRGSAEATEALSALGLSVSHLAGLAPDQQFERIAAALTGVPDPTTRAALAMKLFGKSGRDLLPMIADIEALRAEWRRMGIALSESDVGAADKLGDAWDALQMSFRAVVNVVGAAVAPILTDLAERTALIVQRVGRWTNQNRGLFVSALKVAAAVTGVGAAIVVAGTAILALAKLITPVLFTLGLVVKTLALTKLGLLAMVSPIGLTIAAVLGIAAAILYASGAGAQALGWLGAKFQELGGVAKTAYGGIVDAVASGDLALAGKIAMAGLRAAWLEGTKELSNAWHEVVAGMRALWLQLCAGIGKVWTNLWAGIRATFEGVTTWVAKRMNELRGVFDHGFDAGAANRILDQQNAGTQQDIETGRQTRIDAIDAQLNDDLVNLGEAHGERLKRAAEELREAREHLERLRQEAAIGVQRGEEFGPSHERRPQFDFEGIAEAVQSKLSSTGTFSAAAAFGLAGGPFANLEKKADDQLKVLKDIRRNTEEGATFG